MTTAVATAFVLAGGGSLGAIQVGMLQALAEREITPELIVGTSVGAANGSFIASRPPTTSTTGELERIWIGLRRRDVFPISPVAGLLGVLGLRNHLVRPRRLRKLIEAWQQFERLEDARTPLHLIATDLLNGQELRLSTGPATSAILASAAIPGVFPPVRRGGHELVDGGITNNTPISHAVELGADRIYVLPTGYACTLKRPPRGAIGVAMQALSVLIHQRVVRDIAQVPDDVSLVVLPPLCPLAVSPLDFSRSAELIERSRRSSSEFLDGLDSDVPRAIPDLMHSVSHAH